MDLVVLETLNGGDLQVQGRDLVMIDGLENQVYLALFGGNVGFPSKNLIDTEESFDWWGNNLLMPSNQSIQFNSLFEKKLQTVALTSSGRVELEAAAKADLAFLKDFVTVTVSITIISDDRIQLKIVLDAKKPGQRVKIVNFKRLIVDGDFVLQDFNDDFYFG